MRGDGDEPGVVLGVVGHVVEEHHQTVFVGRTPRRDRRLALVSALGHPAGCGWCRLCHLRQRVGNRRQKPAALRQGGGMGVDPREGVDVRPREANQTMWDWDHGLGDDRQRGMCQQVVRLRYRPGERVLDWEHADGGLTTSDSTHHVGERAARRHVGIREQPAGGLGRVGVPFAEVCNGGGHRSSQQKRPPIIGGLRVACGLPAALKYPLAGW